MSTIRQRVEAGAAALDAIYAAPGSLNWRLVLDAAILAGRFDIGSIDHCVIGELAYAEAPVPAGADRYAYDGEHGEVVREYDSSWTRIAAAVEEHVGGGLDTAGMDNYDLTPFEQREGECRRLEQGWAAVLRGQRA